MTGQHTGHTRVRKNGHGPLFPEDVTIADAIENIDIGGPTMLRSAAKNNRYVGAVTDPGEETMDLTGYVRVFNRSGEEYENAEVRLIVGTINLVEKIADLVKEQRTFVGVLDFAERLLRGAGVVRNRRDGRNIFYRLDDAHVRMLLDLSREHLAHLGDSRLSGGLRFGWGLRRRCHHRPLHRAITGADPRRLAVRRRTS